MPRLPKNGKSAPTVKAPTIEERLALLESKNAALEAENARLKTAPSVSGDFTPHVEIKAGVGRSGTYKYAVLVYAKGMFSETNLGGQKKLDAICKYASLIDEVRKNFESAEIGDVFVA